MALLLELAANKYTKMNFMNNGTCNAIVLSWIMNTVSENLLSGIVYATSAYAVCEDLKERFDKVNRMCNYQLYREINMLSQGTDSGSVYFTKMKSLWSEYDVLVPNTSCGCPKSKDYVDHLYELRLLQFFSGLNELYDQDCKQILLKRDISTINEAYAMIIEDKIQHSSYMITVHEKLEPLAMQVHRNNNLDKGTRIIEEGDMNIVPSQLFSKLGYGFRSHTSCDTTRHMPKDGKGSCQYHHDKSHLPNGATVGISQTVEDYISGDELIKDVSFVLEFKLNLLSVAKVTKELSCFIYFYPNFCVFRDLLSGKVKEIGRQEGGLNIFKNNWKKKLNNAVNMHDKITAEVVAHSSTLWH
ncbi:uncharacterized protein LOC124896553 [Capsicum annuum]|uniref:uncharacterized protein LOC124896553 n=1 Tax=Capsicum annuum TaxID=4072 RepID=UPI001FB166B3|nr:uncharacterized protein LOC124896553 [Capsicum annuum]